MLFEWDTRKADHNQSKHGVTFETASYVFADPYALTEQDRLERGELRWRTIGLVGGISVLFVAHTVEQQGPDELIRIISARRATRRERIRYEENRAPHVG